MYQHRSKAVIPAVLTAAVVLLAAGAAQAGGAYAVSVGDGEPSAHIVLNGRTVFGSGAFIGVALEEETEYAEGGARVNHVVDDSPADLAGIEDGDVIVGIDGTTVRGPRALTKQLEGKEPGDRISLTIVRDGRERKVDVELGDRAEHHQVYGFGHGDHSFRMPHITRMMDCEDDDCSFSFDCEDDDCGFAFDMRHKPLLGVQITETTEELRQHLGSDGAGVLVAKVIADSAAEAAGIQVGDLIVSLDGEEIDDAGDLIRELRDRRGETFEVEVIRDGGLQRLVVTLEEPREKVHPSRKRGTRT